MCAKFVVNTEAKEDVKFVVFGELKQGQNPEKSYLVKAGEKLEGVVANIKPSKLYGKIYTLKVKGEEKPLLITGKTDLRNKLGHGDTKVPKVVVEGDFIQITFVSLSKTNLNHDWYTFEVAVAQ